MAEYSKAESMVISSLFAARGEAERRRRADAEKRQDTYEDDYADVLKERISATFTEANAVELVKVLDTTNNPLKRIVNEMSTIYSSTPARKLSSAPATNLWREILKRAGERVVTPYLNCMVNLHNEAFLYVRPCHDSLTLRIILPQDCTVWPDPDDPTMPLCIEFCERDPAAPNAKPVYHQWDRRPGSEGYRKYDDPSKKPVLELPLKYSDAGRPIIPIIAFHREWRNHSFWDTSSGADLVELTIMVGMWETWLNHLIRTDSWRQRYSSGQVDTTGEQQGGPTNIVNLRNPDGGPVTVGEFSSQADWDGLGGQVKRKLENVLYNYGLVLPDTRTSGDPTSGFALTVRSRGLVKIQQRQVPSYERSEETLYRVVAAVHNFERTNTQFPAIVEQNLPALPPFREAKPKVCFAPIETNRTVEEQKTEQEMDELDIKLGLASPITVYVRRNPEATDDEARAAIEKNLADASNDSAEEVDPTTALNGAQVTALLEVVTSVATKQMPRESGIEIIVAAFPVDRETATRILGPVGSSFFAESPAAGPSGQPDDPKADDAPADEDQAPSTE